MPELRVGLIGLDTSHVTGFTEILNDSSQPFHVPGARIVAAFPGGSPDFALSRDRVAGFTNELSEKFGVSILDSPAAVAQAVDAILLTSVDGRVHLEQFREIAGFGLPTFIDKPFTTSSSDALAIARLAADNGVALFSCSALRFAQPLVDALEELGRPNIWGADIYGPLTLEPTQPGLFWYGIHTVDMLYAVLGRGCESVTATSTADHDVVVGRWNDGRIGTVRGNRKGQNGFGALLHATAGLRFVEAYKHPKPAQAGLMERALGMFSGGPVPVELADTLEVVRFIEAANQSRATGQSVAV